jgi:hypothetical protein
MTDAMPLIHFLLIYDLEKQELVSKPEEFHDAAAAAARYAELETEHRGDPNLEIVLVGADSIDTIKQTHGNYFNGSAPAASPYLVA